MTRPTDDDVLAAVRIARSLRSTTNRADYAARARRLLDQCSAATPEAVRAVEDLEADLRQGDLFDQGPRR